VDAPLIIQGLNPVAEIAKLKARVAALEEAGRR
jgi:hypothetical protein